MKEITKLAGQNVQALVSFTNTYTYITHIMSAGHVSKCQLHFSLVVASREWVELWYNMQ